VKRLRQVPGRFAVAKEDELVHREEGASRVAHGAIVAPGSAREREFYNSHFADAPLPRSLSFVLDNWYLFATAIASGALLLWPTPGGGVGGGRVSAADAVRLINREKAVLIDISDPAEYAAGHAVGAKSVPLASLETSRELPKNKSLPVVVVCPTGARAPRAVARAEEARLRELDRARRRPGRLASRQPADREDRLVRARPPMQPVKMYSTATCPYCLRAKALLKQRGVETIDEIRVDLEPDERENMVRLTHRWTVPQIFIGAPTSAAATSSSRSTAAAASSRSSPARDNRAARFGAILRSPAASITSETAMAADPSTLPTLNIQRLYLKDLSLEQPNSPQILSSRASRRSRSTSRRRRVGRGFDLRVTLTATVTTKLNDKTLFLVEAKQGGIFEIKEPHRRALKQALGVICPNIVYPYLRAIVSDVCTRAGFPPVVLSEFNFQAIVRSAAGTGAGAGRGTRRTDRASSAPPARSPTARSSRGAVRQ
jgi:preprotein translocase subunit SecB